MRCRERNQLIILDTNEELESININELVPIFTKPVSYIYCEYNNKTYGL